MIKSSLFLITLLSLITPSTSSTLCLSILKNWSHIGGSVLLQSTESNDLACSDKCKANVNCGSASFSAGTKKCRLFQMKDLVIRQSGTDSAIVKYTTTTPQCLPTSFANLSSRKIWSPLPGINKSVKFGYLGSGMEVQRIQINFQ